jgi:hypothetical protein
MDQDVPMDFWFEMPTPTEGGARPSATTQNFGGECTARLLNALRDDLFSSPENKTRFGEHLIFCAMHSVRGRSATEVRRFQTPHARHANFRVVPKSHKRLARQEYLHGLADWMLVLKQHHQTVQPKISPPTAQGAINTAAAGRRQKFKAAAIPVVSPAGLRLAELGSKS